DSAGGAQTPGSRAVALQRRGPDRLVVEAVSARLRPERLRRATPGREPRAIEHHGRAWPGPQGLAAEGGPETLLPFQGVTAYLPLAQRPRLRRRGRGTG